MTTEEILAQLDTHDYSHFPREALQAALENQEAITPALLGIVERIADQPEWLDEHMDYMGFVYALFLLAQFREQRAYPLMSRYFGSLGTELEAIDATEDIVTEYLGRMLASVCHGDLSLIKPIIENPEVNEFVRSACLTALVTLYNTGQLVREDLVTYLQALIDSKFEQDEAVFFWGGLVNSGLEIYPGELYQALVNCLERGLVEPLFMSKKELDQAMKKGKEQVLQKLKQDRHYQLINDVIAELEWWACFHPEPDISRFKAKSAPDFNYYTPAPKIGRNDPCPCGSGKKYKKCCLNLS